MLRFLRGAPPSTTPESRPTPLSSIEAQWDALIQANQVIVDTMNDLLAYVQSEPPSPGRDAVLARVEANHRRHAELVARIERMRGIR